MTTDLDGQLAPDFTLTDQHGRSLALSSFRGAPVLLVFVPYAFSDTCTNELIDLRDAEDLRSGDAVTVLVASCDSVYTIKAWADSHRYTGVLLSDFWPHGEVARGYGVFDDRKGLASRGTFLIDADGVVRWTVRNPMGEARRLEDYRDALAAL